MICPFCRKKMWRPGETLKWWICLGCFHQIGHEPMCKEDLDELDAILAEEG